MLLEPRPAALSLQPLGAIAAQIKHLCSSLLSHMTSMLQADTGI